MNTEKLLSEFMENVMFTPEGWINGTIDGTDYRIPTYTVSNIINNLPTQEAMKREIKSRLIKIN